MTSIESINGFETASAGSLTPRERAIIARRQHILGPTYQLFYEHPVEVVRGVGAHVFDPEGNDYLDCYNNVPSVGHANPRVIEAVARQLAEVNTHTRYLHPAILNYAEDLLSTFEQNLDRAMFTCTGSEANDLAYRLAQKATGARGVIVSAGAYHGNTEATSAFSPALGSATALGLEVRTIPSPDSYRIPKTELGPWLAGQVRRQIDDLEQHGVQLAAFFADSVFSSDGIYTDPPGFLRDVARVVHAAGGLYVADEVQSGFGRCGDAMWGYQRHGVTADIVTLGKPMGNGFPVAGLVTSAAILDTFGTQGGYFNTYGGNPVAVAAAQAVLAEIQEQNLAAHALQMGDLLTAELLRCASGDPRIGNIRHAGLFIGVEFVTDTETKTPDPETALAVVNGLRERRVLISATGNMGQTLKIRPPMVFNQSDAERFLESFEATLAQVA